VTEVIYKLSVQSVTAFGNPERQMRSTDGCHGLQIDAHDTLLAYGCTQGKVQILDARNLNPLNTFNISSVRSASVMM